MEVDVAQKVDEKPCPRARHNGTTIARFLVTKDPAVQDIARRVVAGIDQRYRVHPHYKSWATVYGRDRAQEIIRDAVTFPGACDIIQTDMCLGGVGLFGGLSEDEKEFIFYEWADSNATMRVHMTHQDARDIVSGMKRFITFIPCTEAHFARRQRAKKKLQKNYAK